MFTTGFCNAVPHAYKFAICFASLVNTDQGDVSTSRKAAQEDIDLMFRAIIQKRNLATG
jgi:hypothetical protein